MDDVDQEIQQNDQGGVKKHGAEHEGVIAIGGRLDEMPAEARDLEDGFNDKRAADDAGKAGPRKLTVGSSPPRRACFTTTRVSERPLARAVLMKSWLSVSSMPPRVSRATMAA